MVLGLSSLVRYWKEKHQKMYMTKKLQKHTHYSTNIFFVNGHYLRKILLFFMALKIVLLSKKQLHFKLGTIWMRLCLLGKRPKCTPFWQNMCFVTLYYCLTLLYSIRLLTPLRNMYETTNTAHIQALPQSNTIKLRPVGHNYLVKEGAGQTAFASLHK